jgi:glutamate-1-semialdehyde 2,1-aminomutase
MLMKSTNRSAKLAEAVARATDRYVQRNPESRTRFAAAAVAMPGGNTRSSLFHDPFPLCMASGSGCRLRDVDGHEYIDFLGEFTAGIFGHSPEPLKAAIRAALDGGINLSSHNPLEGELAGLIRARFASMELLRFTNSGTEANLMALAAAKAFTRRSKVLVFEGGYHGGVLSFPKRETPVNVPHQFLIAPYNDLARALELIRENRGDLAAILVEPMLGAGGCVPGDSQFLSGLRRAATDAGAALIFDEIQTSRLAIGGRQSVLGIAPDLTTIGKFFGGGLAFGCFGGRHEIMQLFDPRRPDALGHAGTFNNNTLTMAAGIAAVRLLLTEENFGAVNARGEKLRGEMNTLFAARGAPFRVTGLGSLMNIHPTAPAEDADALRRLLFFDLAERGVYIAMRGLMALSFPVGEDETTALLAALDDLIGARGALFQ